MVGVVAVVGGVLWLFLFLLFCCCCLDAFKMFLAHNLISSRIDFEYRGKL